MCRTEPAEIAALAESAALAGFQPSPKPWARSVRVLAAMIALGAVGGLVGCASGPTGGPNAEAARAELLNLGHAVVASVGGEILETNQGTASCEYETDGGVDSTFQLEFTAPDYMSRVGMAVATLEEAGYEVSLVAGHDAPKANGPNGEIVVLKSQQLTLFTGCVVG